MSRKPRILPEQTAEKGYWKHRFVEGMPYKLYRKRQLEDLQKFGAEKGIAKLVQEINKYPYMVTCGSCEGHKYIFQLPFVNIAIKKNHAKKVMNKLEEVENIEIIEISSTPTKTITIHIKIGELAKQSLIQKIKDLRK